jgi:tRNA pseudouridine55 synthase
VSRRRKQKGRPISGWLILDKPVDMGSTEAVSKIKWLFGAQKAGHAGTLDPLASGSLPIALGDATKTVPYVMDGRKIYRFTVTWGSETTTDDLEGSVTETSEIRPSEQAIRDVMPNYVGEIDQIPPQFSAIKINGERAYDIAREGETVDIPARTVTIHRFDLLSVAADSSEFEIECGKGTYVRSLARDMGRQLGCFGHISALRRTEVAPFAEATMVELSALVAAEELELSERHELCDSHLVNTTHALSALPEIVISSDQSNRLRRGNSIILRGRDAPLNCDDAYASSGGHLIAIGSVADGQFHPRRVFN